MNRALAFDTDSALAANRKAPSPNLRVSHPGDSSEIEADRAAETVSQGGRIARWVLSAVHFDGVQRQAVPPQPPLQQPQQYSTGDIAGKLADAIMATKEGKEAIEKITSDPEVRDAIDLATSPLGIVIEGSAAAGIIALLANAHQPLPLQVPKIPLDRVYPGLGVKVTYTGPVDRPTGASITLSLERKGDEKKRKRDQAENKRTETNREVLELERFREGLRRGSTDPATIAEEQAAEAVAAKYGPPLPFIGGGAHKSEQPPGMQLTLPTFEAARKERHATLLDKKLELKPMASPAETPTAGEKKEEIPVQRKAETVVSDYADPAEVEAIVHSPGCSLDAETRRAMESRIGFDFSKVRIHTDARASASAHSLGARAYTVGSDLVFAAGHYSPTSAEGRRLLAHELTHVVQQTAPAHKPHPVLRPAPRHVQRLWGIGIPDGRTWLLGGLKNLEACGPVEEGAAEKRLQSLSRIVKPAQYDNESGLKPLITANDRKARGRKPQQA